MGQNLKKIIYEQQFKVKKILFIETYYIKYQNKDSRNWYSRM